MHKGLNMPNDNTQSNAPWPLLKFSFEVKWDDTVMHFQEVSGLDVEGQPIEYRHGNSPVFSAIKMPGIKKYGRVTMKKGMSKGEAQQSMDWLNAVSMNTIQRKTVTISLLDEAGQPTMVWTLVNAWPAKITGTDLRDGSIVAVETMEFAHEGFTMRNG
jgi:phage tail-like protein